MNIDEKNTKTLIMKKTKFVYQGAVNAEFNAKSKEMTTALMEVPYLKEILVGGELAKLAFNYVKAHSSL